MEYFEQSVGGRTGEPMITDEMPNPFEHTIPSVPTIPIQPTNFIDQAQSRTDLTEAMRRFLHSHHRSWRLQEIVGERIATPYSKPPDVPIDIETRFKYGLMQLEKRENDDNELWSNSVQAMLGVQQPANWPSNSSFATNRRDSGVEVGESGVSDHSSLNSSYYFGSNTAVQVNEAFQAENSRATSHSYPMQTSNFPVEPGHEQILPLGISNFNPDWVGDAGFSIPHPSMQAPTSIQTGHNITFLNALPGFENWNAQSNESGFHQVPHQNVGQMALFLSPGLEKGAYEALQPAIGLNASISYSTGSNPDIAFHDQAQYPLGLAHKNSRPQTPHINVQLRSPTNLLYSDMRPLPPMLDEKSNPSQTLARTDDHTGLPFAAGDENMVWTSGYMPGLSLVLTNWTTTMLDLYRLCAHPSMFSHNDAFPRPVEPVTYHKLVAVAFYDASERPHQEIIFVGPGDGNDIAYGEVDMFRCTNSFTDHHKQQSRFGSVLAMKDRIPHDYRPRHVTPDQRAEIGEGQWMYIHMQTSSSLPGKPIPYIIIAFPTCAITFKSNAPHNVFPDNYNPMLPRMQNTQIGKHTQSQYRRFATMQSHAVAQRDPKRLQQFLRMSSPPEFNHPYAGPLEGAPTLFRTVLELGKAGRVPLFDGHGVDSLQFTPWLHAAGNGAGRVVMWTEMDQVTA